MRARAREDGGDMGGDMGGRCSRVLASGLEATTPRPHSVERADG
jgi:hypothetical protein